jgi:hypothetical protein
MKKGLFVVCVDNYQPEISAVTLPMLKAYAKKIGAEFTVITERKYPEFPPTYEKMQVYELGKNNDVNLLIDADMYVTEDMYDVTEVVPEGVVGSWMEYDPWITIKKDEYLKLDGTDRIPATNFLVVWAGQHETWKPLVMLPTVALSRMKRPFVVDEYCVGRNIKQHGYKTQGLSLPGAYGNLFTHGNVTTGIGE